MLLFKTTNNAVRIKANSGLLGKKTKVRGVKIYMYGDDKTILNIYYVLKPSAT